MRGVHLDPLVEGLAAEHDLQRHDGDAELLGQVAGRYAVESVTTATRRRVIAGTTTFTSFGARTMTVRTVVRPAP